MPHVRFARATDHLDEAVRFWRDGVGLDVIGSFRDHEGFDGVMLGKRGEGWHLELTHERGAHAGRAPTQENLVVLYFDHDEAAFSAAVARMASHGFRATAAHNPYWERAGKTFLDVDGYGVVFARGAWEPEAPQAPAFVDDKPHSAQFLTDARDLYWNDDFLALISSRLALGDVRRAVDVGSGLGHWTRRVARALAPSAAEVVGVEREAAWVAQASARDAQDEPRIRYVQGSAETLPFDDESVDLVTCQTLLIHVEDPARVLAEMHRVLKRGGVLLCAEPNNWGASLYADAWVAGQSVDDVLAYARLEMTCQLGKRALGLGFNSLGETLVGLLAPSSWRELRVWNSDRAYAARSPYPDDAKAMLAQERAWHDEGALLWPYEETRRYFVAGGGDDAQLPALWEAVRRVQAKKLRAVDDGTFAAAMGGFLYLVAARRV